jgi:phenylacetate-CoA ligase
LVRHAYSHVPGYRRLLDAHGVRPEEIRGVEDLCRLPIVAKEDLANLPEADRIARIPRLLPVRRRFTTGSTGVPFLVSASQFEDKFLAAHRLRIMVHWGWRPWRTFARIRLPAPYLRLPLPMRWLAAAGFRPFWTMDCTIGPDAILDELERLNPQVISGYPVILESIAKRLVERRSRISPDLVVVGGAVLDADCRAYLEQTFKAPVREIYGCHETNTVAIQCPMTGNLHACEETVLLEVLREERSAAPGETGEVVVTALHSFHQPFIRFRLSDQVRRAEHPCPCGFTGLSLASVEGRVGEWIPVPGGLRVFVDQATAPLRTASDWISRFQLYQPALDLLELHVILRRKPSPEEEDGIRAGMERILGGTVRVSLKPVVALVHEPSGKHKKLRSNILPPPRPQK